MRLLRTNRDLAAMGRTELDLPRMRLVDPEIERLLGFLERDVHRPLTGYGWDRTRLGAC